MAGKIDKCKSCGARIVWALTENGMSTPMDADPVLVGEWTLGRGAGGPRVIRAGTDHPSPPWKRYQPHWATCPNTKKHRKGRP